MKISLVPLTTNSVTQYWTFPVFHDIKGVQVVIGSRAVGTDTKLVASELQLSQPITQAEQVHGSAVSVVSRASGDKVPAADALITAHKNVPIAIRTADCGPLVLYDKTHHVMGVVHVGWKGLLAGIIQNTLSKLASEFQTKPSDLLVGLGPSIHSCHYQVRSDFRNSVITADPDFSRFFENDDSSMSFDLPAAIQQVCLSAGVPWASFHDASVCTACNLESFYSYRQEKQPGIGFLSTAWLT